MILISILKFLIQLFKTGTQIETTTTTITTEINKNLAKTPVPVGTQRFNRLRFWTEFRHAFGSVTEKQVRNAEILLTFLEQDKNLKNLNQIVYILATVYHETAKTFEPLEEYGKGRGRAYGVPDSKTGVIYYGRGYVQLTHKKNYQLLGNYLGYDLVHEPNQALVPKVAYEIMSLGMREGLFTGRGLTDYINETEVDYVNARRIVNGTDKARLIANHAKLIEKCLKEI